VTNRDVDEILSESLSALEARVPAAEDDGEFGPQLSHEPAHRYGIADHRPGQKGDAEA
jgi:hypothetical protein